MFSAATSYFQNRDDNKLRASGQGAYSPISQLRPGEDQYAAAARRTTAFDQAAGTNPGRAIGGTGSTGLLPNDAAGWSNLVNERNQYAKDTALLSGRAAPTINVQPSLQTVTRRNTTMTPGMSGLTSAVRGLRTSGEDGFAALLDQKLARKFAHSSADETMQGMRTLGMSPLEEQAQINRDYAGAVGAREAVRDPFERLMESEDFEDYSAMRGGERYNIPAVKSMRESDLANRMGLLRQQYITPAEIKAQADLGSAEAGLIGDRERAAADRDVARYGMQGRQAQALGPIAGMVGDFAGYEKSLADPAVRKLVEMVMQMAQRR